MAKTNIYDDKSIRYVDLQHPTATAVKFLYFFKTNVDASEVVALGQTAVTEIPATLPSPAIAGTRKPTPLKVFNAKKRIQSLCSTSKFGTAQAAGWRRIEAPAFNTARIQSAPAAGSRGSILLTVDTPSLGGDISYGWFMPAQQYLKITDAERTALGIVAPTTEAGWAAVILGCDKIQPARARKTTFSGDGTVVGGSDTTETFYKAGNALPDGWVKSLDALSFAL